MRDPPEAPAAGEPVLATPLAPARLEFAFFPDKLSTFRVHGMDSRTAIGWRYDPGCDARAEEIVRGLTLFRLDHDPVHDAFIGHGRVMDEDVEKACVLAIDGVQAREYSTSGFLIIRPKKSPAVVECVAGTLRALKIRSAKDRFSHPSLLRHLPFTPAAHIMSSAAICALYESLFTNDVAAAILTEMRNEIKDAARAAVTAPSPVPAPVRIVTDRQAGSSRTLHIATKATQMARRTNGPPPESAKILGYDIPAPKESGPSGVSPESRAYSPELGDDDYVDASTELRAVPAPAPSEASSEGPPPLEEATTSARPSKLDIARKTTPVVSTTQGEVKAAMATLTPQERDAVRGLLAASPQALRSAAPSQRVLPDDVSDIFPLDSVDEAKQKKARSRDIPQPPPTVDDDVVMLSRPPSPPMPATNAARSNGPRPAQVIPDLPQGIDIAQWLLTSARMAHATMQAPTGAGPRNYALAHGPPHQTTDPRPRPAPQRAPATATIPLQGAFHAAPMPPPEPTVHRRPPPPVPPPVIDTDRKRRAQGSGRGRQRSKKVRSSNPYVSDSSSQFPDVDPYDYPLDLRTLSVRPRLSATRSLIHSSPQQDPVAVPFADAPTRCQLGAPATIMGPTPTRGATAVYHAMVAAPRHPDTPRPSLAAPAFDAHTLRTADIGRYATAPVPSAPRLVDAVKPSLSAFPLAADIFVTEQRPPARSMSFRVEGSPAHLPRTYPALVMPRDAALYQRTEDAATAIFNRRLAAFSTVMAELALLQCEPSGHVATFLHRVLVEVPGSLLWADCFIPPADNVGNPLLFPAELMATRIARNYWHLRGSQTEYTRRRAAATGDLLRMYDIPRTDLDSIYLLRSSGRLGAAFYMPGSLVPDVYHPHRN
ncbi:hypothetical protein PsYK624_157440 [Phanerochaete sordida]|uniref:Uncharacterized protein n=1 Tax=Phanerochaete sordida TaxID=48140 RepID=A0A9P3GTG5_9APHY|nr:hypothetical protein PsYK624_157440 [Phanerochaete sordida]